MCRPICHGWLIIHLFFHSFILSFILSFIHSFILSFFHSFFHLIFHSFIHSFFLCLFFDSLIHSFILERRNCQVSSSAGADGICPVVTETPTQEQCYPRKFNLYLRSRYSYHVRRGVGGNRMKYWLHPLQIE